MRTKHIVSCSYHIYPNLGIPTARACSKQILLLSNPASFPRRQNGIQWPIVRRQNHRPILCQVIQGPTVGLTKMTICRSQGPKLTPPAQSLARRARAIVSVTLFSLHYKPNLKKPWEFIGSWCSFSDWKTSYSLYSMRLFLLHGFTLSNVWSPFLPILRDHRSDSPLPLEFSVSG